MNETEKICFNKRDIDEIQLVRFLDLIVIAPLLLYVAIILRKRGHYALSTIVGALAIGTFFFNYRNWYLTCQLYQEIKEAKKEKKCGCEDSSSKVKLNGVKSKLSFQN